MTGTDFGDSRDVIPNMTPSYRYVKNLDGQKLGAEKLVNNYAEFPPFRRTASGMNSTAEDLARWLIALQQGKLLKTKSALDAPLVCRNIQQRFANPLGSRLDDQAAPETPRGCRLGRQPGSLFRLSRR